MDPDERVPDEQLPIELGPISNDEYVPPPQTPLLAEVERRARELIDRQARRRGMTRRRFLQTTMATAAVLLTLDACSTEEQASKGRGSPGGRLRVPEEATIEPDAAKEVLGGDEFVFDVQTHWLQYDLSQPGGNFGAGFPQASCGLADPRACFDIEHYLEALFRDSDTTLAVVSAIPASDNNGPLSTAIMAEGRDAAHRFCGDDRVILHGQALPAVGSLGTQLDAMSALVRDYQLGAWKVYTHAPVNWFLDDHDPRLPQVGNAFLDRVRETGLKIVCVHKGFGAAVSDLGPAAAAHPDIAFVAYHSGYEPGGFEGPYHPNGQGVDRFLRTVTENGPGPGKNVYAELGSTWFNVMREPETAAHVLGKVLTAVGPSNVLWGTDSIWYGSPQPQIEAFRAFEVTPEYQERFGYPALTPEVKQQILGLNAARLYNVTPRKPRCAPR
jgi:hypothetical protein